MNFKAKLGILSFFIGILSILNLQQGLFLKTTDNTAHDAIFLPNAIKTEKPTLKADTSTPVTLASTSAQHHAQIATSNSSIFKKAIEPKPQVAAKTTPLNFIKINSRTIQLLPANCNTMPTPNYSSANFCHYGGSSNLFIYGHNTNAIFGTLKNLPVGASFTVTLNGETTTYRISKTFIKSTIELSQNNGLRSSIFKGFYGGSADIMIQTCHGPNDSERLYLKAVRI